MIRLKCHKDIISTRKHKGKRQGQVNSILIVVLTCLNSFVFPYTFVFPCLWKAVLILSGLSDSCYFHLCFPWVAGASIDTGGKASLGAFLPAGGTAPLLPAQTDHLWAAGEEQPAEHRYGRSTAKDRGASAGQDPPAAWYIHYVEASLYSICDSCVWTTDMWYVKLQYPEVKES